MLMNIPLRQKILSCMKKKIPFLILSYLFELVKSIVWPFFRHDTIGSGDPFGGPHSNIAVSPWATRVFCGSKRNSSRSTAKKRKERYNDEMKWFLYVFFLLLKSRHLKVHLQNNFLFSDSRLLIPIIHSSFFFSLFLSSAVIKLWMNNNENHNKIKLYL